MTSSHGAVIKDSKIKFGNAFGNPINFLKETVFGLVPVIIKEDGQMVTN